MNMYQFNRKPGNTPGSKNKDNQRWHLTEEKTPRCGEKITTLSESGRYEETGIVERDNATRRLWIRNGNTLSPLASWKYWKYTKGDTGMKWKRVSTYTMGLIEDIANRYLKIIDPAADRLDVIMDITAANQTTPLDLERLLSAKDHDFGHDVAGIRKYLNRKDGTLTGGFLPRHTKK